MKKKFLTVLLAIVAALCLCFGLAACGETPKDPTGTTQTQTGGGENNQEDGGNNNQGGGNNNSSHIHSYGNWEIVVPATHTTTGTRRKYCSCGDHIDETIAKTTAHEYGSWQITRDATHLVAGEKQRTCACGAVETDTIPKTTAHEYGNWQITRDATHLVAGEKQRTCPCGAVETDIIPKTTAHEYGNWQVTRGATHLLEGEKQRTCPCGEIETETIPKTTAHEYGNWQTTRDATHLLEGEKQRTCPCGETETETIPKTTEHTFLPYSKQDATCTAAGEEVLRCECGEEQHNTIPQKKHTYNKGVCSVCGSVEGLIAFRTLEVSDDDTVYGKASNQTETFSFIQEILFADGVTFIVSYDLGGTNTIPTKTVSLEIGDNTYYVLASRGNDLKLYTVTVRRRPVYNVSFETSGSAVEPQQVEEDSEITPPAVTAKTGYTFQKWTLGGTEATFPYKAEEGITQENDYSVTFHAVFTANDYKATLDAKGGEVSDGEQTVTFDERYNFPVPTRTGYTFLGWYEGENQLTNTEGASLSAWTYDEGKQIDAHWSVNSYRLTVEENLPDAGTVTGGGSYDYESSVTVTATTNIGYNFLGWYDEENECVSEQESYSFTMGFAQTLTAKWQVVPEMTNFNFSSTPTTCTISGIRDKTVTEIVIPEYVTAIGDSAFKDCSRLESVVWNAENCITAGSFSYPIFEGCTDLKTVTLGENVKEIPRYAFKNYSGLEHISVSPDNQTYYSEEDCLIETGSKTLILGCKNSKIPDTVTSIGDHAFDGCSGLESITIPDNVTSIEEGAFSGCSGLESMTLPFVGGSRKTASDTYQYPFGFIFGTSSYAGASAVKQTYHQFSINSTVSSTYYIPDSLKSVIVTGGNILYGAFSGCSGLKSVTIGSGVTEIGGSAFYNCSRLESVFWNAENCETGGFSGCENLKTVTFGETVKIIPAYAFSDCGGLQSVTIPDSVTTIGEYAFYNCSGLMGELKIPNNVTTIGEYAFNDCWKLNSVVWNAENCTTAGSSAYPIFDSSAYLKTVTFGENVKTIPAFAFYNCSGLTGELKIPDSVTTIGEYIFYGCSKLTSVTIPSGVTSIGSGAFEKCSGLTGVYIADLTAWCKIDFGNEYANPLYYAKHLFLDDVEVKDLTIPAEITEIKPYTFAGCRGLTSVTIGDGMTSIGDNAFYGCSGLESVTIGSGVTSIGRCAFSGCSGLTSIEIPDGVTSIEDSAFSGCSGLESITIPDNVTEIGEYAFYNCSGLESVIWNAENCTKAGDYPYTIFSECTNLETVTFGENVKIIPAYAFYHRSGLTSIVIPDSVTSIGLSAFSGCSGLESVTIGSGVTSIGSEAFIGCSGLTSIVIPASVTSIGDYAFAGCSGLTSATFVNPNGWSASGGRHSGGYYRVEMDPDELASPSTAAQRLRSYVDYVWKRNG